MTDQTDDNRAEGRTSSQPLPNTQAPRAGSAPDAGDRSPAEKSEPSGVPRQEQLHNADPNAPQTQVVPPGSTQNDPESTEGVPASSLRQGPDDGTDEARRRAQVTNVPPPPEAGEGAVEQRNDPNEH